MKTHMRKLLAFVLTLILISSLWLPAQAAGENNTLGITFSATLDTPTITASDVDQTVIMRITSSAEITVDGIGFTVTWDAPLTLAAITGGEKLGAYDAAATNLANGKAYWGAADLENVSGVTEIAVITFTIPANTPAGAYNVGVTGLELTRDFAETTWENSASASTVLTVEEAAAVEEYTAGVSTLGSTAAIGDVVNVNVSVAHGSDTSFAAGEVVVSYDTALLTFNEGASTLGNATIKAEAGQITLEDYGANKNFGSGVYVLAFDAIAEGQATVTLASAGFVNKENAVKSDLIPAALSPESVTVTIEQKTFSVTLPEIFEGPSEVTNGESYTFSVADGNNYDYTDVTATVNGTPVTVIDNGDGTYTVENVTGPLVITGTRTEKTYAVTFEGNAGSEITDGAANATYGTDYTFTMPSASGWAYSLESITIGGQAYTGYSVAGSVYTIPGTAISGDIVITVNKSATEASVTVEGSGAGAAAGYSAVATIGQPYTLTITPEAGYEYTVTATMGGVAVSVADNGDNTYTIQNVTGNIVFTVEQIMVVDGISVSRYLALDGTSIWLIKNTTELEDGKVSAYDGQNMFWSEKYNAYCYLAIAETMNVNDITGLVRIVDGTAKSVVYDMDVNITGKVDASDAQLTYNMYNAAYAGFTADATMEKFLRADTNGDGIVNVEDAAAIIAFILN